MRMQSVALASALPAAAVIGYAVLTGYLLTRVRPAPIAVLPRNLVSEGGDTPGPMFG